MKKLLSITLAAALVTATTGSAMAHPANYPHRHDRHGHIVRVAPPPAHQYRRDNNNGAAVVFGLLALGTIAALAANNNREDNYRSGNYRNDSYGYDDGYYGDSFYGYNGPYNYPPPNHYGHR